MDLPRETLLELLELQKIDSTIDRLEGRKRNLPEQAELEELEEKLTSIEKQIAEQQSVVDDVVTRHNKLDGDVDLISKKIAEEQEKLYSGNLTSPRELSALQAEVESLGRRKKAMEDAELEVMEEREKAEGLLRGFTEEAESTQSAVDEARQRRDTAATDIDAQLTEARAEREKRSPKFSAEVLEFYDGLREQRGGVAIAALSDGTCQGCNMRLPAQEVERVRAVKGVAYCDECRRVLVAV